MWHQNRIRLIALTILAACTVWAAADAANPKPVVTVYAAGSLRGVVGDLAAQVEHAYGIEVTTTFGGSGTLRKRIEHGAPADLFLSADVASPRKLQAAGHTVVPPVAFARNRMCILSPGSAAVTAGNLVHHMLARGTRIWTSTPVVDPAGDYAAAIFDKVDALHPGAGATLAARAGAVRKAAAKFAPPGTRNRFAKLFADHRIDMMITYCSAAPTLQQKVPGLASLAVPPPLAPHPVDAMAVLSGRPAVLRVALYLMSRRGQAIIAQNDFVPVMEPATTPSSPKR